MIYSRYNSSKHPFFECRNKHKMIVIIFLFWRILFVWIFYRVYPRFLYYFSFDNLFGKFI